MSLASLLKLSKNSTGTTSVFFFSVAIHGVLALVAGLWIVAKYIQDAPPKFQAPPKPRISIPAQTKQHRLNIASRQSSAPAPRLQKRLISLRPSPIALPDIPDSAKLPSVSTPLSSQFSSLNSLQGIGGIGAGLSVGTGLGGTGMGKGAGFQFMGVQTQGQRVFLLFDVSTSVVNKAKKSGVPMSKIKDETLKLLESLPVNARFGIVQFVRNFKPFHEDLLPASPQNRDLAKAWIESEWNESGQLAKGRRGVISPDPNGLTSVLEFVFEKKPDTIFLISDGSFQRGTNETILNSEIDAFLKEYQPKAGPKSRLHFIGFGMKEEDKKDWSRFTKASGGKLNEIAELPSNKQESSKTKTAKSSKKSKDEDQD